MAAPGGYISAMKKSGSKNFWALQYYLPQESRNHVKKFIATHYIMEAQWEWISPVNANSLFNARYQIHMIIKIH